MNKIQKEHILIEAERKYGYDSSEYAMIAGQLCDEDITEEIVEQMANMLGTTPDNVIVLNDSTRSIKVLYSVDDSESVLGYRTESKIFDIDKLGNVIF